jgi:hypothetical protein
MHYGLFISNSNYNNKILIYLRVNLTAQRVITKLAQRKETKTHTNKIQKQRNLYGGSGDGESHFAGLKGK